MRLTELDLLEAVEGVQFARENIDDSKLSPIRKRMVLKKLIEAEHVLHEILKDSIPDRLKPPMENENEEI